MSGTETIVSIVSKSIFFDADWYSARYPDIEKTGLSPAEHYLRIGAFSGYDPGPKFSTSYYLRAYPNVARAGLNPLVHCEENVKATASSPDAPPIIATPDNFLGRIDVVVPVFNALDDVKSCLRSLAEASSDYQSRIIIVNDGSDDETTNWLRGAIEGLSNEQTVFTLIEHEQNMGYTKAVNTGLRASTAPYVVTLNSDTIVTPYWADGLVRCMHSADDIGICGPLSNAANWQSVPNLYDSNGKFAINSLPGGMTPDEMARLVLSVSCRDYPRTNFVNGFCFMIRREVIESIGYMDEEAFPTGYGEENDYCVRAQDAGYALAYADDTYVFHAKSKSFGHERRIALSKAGTAALRRKHGSKFENLASRLKDTRQMDAVRHRIKMSLATATETQGSALSLLMSQRILFLLPVKGGSGGAHSVVQEAVAMRRLGVDAKIAVKSGDRAHYCRQYNDIPEAAQIFVEFSPATLAKNATGYDVVVATIFHSVKLLKTVTDRCPWILPAYYIQDYEPFFFEEGSENWQIARSSYDLIPNAVLFAKTDWIREQVERNHGVKVHKVLPSIDHDVYRPGPRELSKSNICIAAMIRPKTPRRGALRTMHLLKRLSDAFSDKVSISIFGCDDQDADFGNLPKDFKFRNAGVLKRSGVAELLQETDIFVDLSDYQAFGRTAAEAMACGAVSVVPREGGAGEYAVDGVNALVVDTFDLDACFESIGALLNNPNKLQEMRLAALATVSAYSPRRAAMSELIVFASRLAELRKIEPSPLRRDVPIKTPGGRNHYLGHLKWGLRRAQFKRFLVYPVAKWRKKQIRIIHELKGEIALIEHREKMALEYRKNQ
ncbi:glycosyltransferase [Ensifer sp. MPMI2T]|nr:glycosyltransferase [Ensifer sp. MPMI2T]